MINHLPLATVCCRPPDLCIVSAAPLGMFRLSMNYSLEESLSSTHFLKVPLGRWLCNTSCDILDPASPSTWLCQALLSPHVDSKWGWVPGTHQLTTEQNSEHVLSGKSLAQSKGHIPLQHTGILVTRKQHCPLLT